MLSTTSIKNLERYLLDINRVMSHNDVLNSLQDEVINDRSNEAMEILNKISDQVLSTRKIFAELFPFIIEHNQKLKSITGEI